MAGKSSAETRSRQSDDYNDALIAAVRRQDCIWDMAHVNYNKNKSDEVKTAWETVLKELDCYFDATQAKTEQLDKLKKGWYQLWKKFNQAVTETYIPQLDESKAPPPWKFLEKMSFILPKYGHQIPKVLQQYYDGLLQRMDRFYRYPKWRDDSFRGENVICIPAMLDMTRQYVGPVNAEASSFNPSKYREEHYRGDNGEQEILEKFSSLDIGGILIAGIERTEVMEAIKSVLEENTIPEKMNYSVSRYVERPDAWQLDFIFLHPSIGFYYIEVKNPGTGKPNTLYKNAAGQLLENIGKLQELFACCTGSTLAEEALMAPYLAAALPFHSVTAQCLPGLEKIDVSLLSSAEKWKDFWSTKLDIAKQKDPGRNWFNDAHFRNVVALLTGYRGVSFMSAAQNAVSIALVLQQQLLLSFKNQLRAEKVCMRQNDSNASLMNVNKNAKLCQPAEASGGMDDVCYFTKEQLSALNSSASQQPGVVHLIYGVCGTGKTVIAMHLLLRAVYDSTRADVPLLILTWKKHMSKFQEMLDKLPRTSRKVSIGYDQGIGTEAIKNGANADIICDEMGLIASGFLVWRIECCKAYKTTCIITGSTSPANIRKIKSQVEDFLNHSELVHETALSTVMRGTRRIVDYWSAELTVPDDLKLKVGHNFVGLQPETLSLATSRNVLAALVTRLSQFDYQEIPWKHIAVITPTTFEAKVIEQHLRLFGVPCRDLPVLSKSAVTLAGDSEEFVSVDSYDNVLSHEWPIVIMCSFIYANIHENYKLMAASRAVGLLIEIKRDFDAVQRIIEQTLSAQPPQYLSRNYLEERCFASDEQWDLAKDMTNSSWVVRLAAEFSQQPAESQSPIAQIHLLLTILRTDFLSTDPHLHSPPFQYCPSRLTSCLGMIMKSPYQMNSLFQSFLEDSRETQAFIHAYQEAIKKGITAKKSEKVTIYPAGDDLHVFPLDPRGEQTKLMKDLPSAADQNPSYFPAPYRRFLDGWAWYLQKFLQEPELFQKPPPTENAPEQSGTAVQCRGGGGLGDWSMKHYTENSVWKLVVQCADILILNQCAYQFGPID